MPIFITRCLSKKVHSYFFSVQNTDCIQRVMLLRKKSFWLITEGHTCSSVFSEKIIVFFYFISYVEFLCFVHTFSPSTTLGVPFPKNFQQVCKKILSRLFRVFVHVYIHHFDSICSMGAEAHINTCYKHYYYFISEFNLIDHSELEPLVRIRRDRRGVRGAVECFHIENAVSVALRAISVAQNISHAAIWSLVVHSKVEFLFAF